MEAQSLLFSTTETLNNFGNGLSLMMVEFLNNVRTKPLGFRELGLDFLGICEVVNSLNTSLQEHFHTDQPFPEGAIPELLRTLNKTSDDFSKLQQLLKKFMEYEKGGAFATLQKTWRVFFADKDIARVHTSLQENKGALNMTMLLTKINPNVANASVTYEHGLLAARLQQSDVSSVSALDQPSSHVGSVFAPPVPSSYSDTIPVPSMSKLALDDSLVPVEHPSPHAQTAKQHELASPPNLVSPTVEPVGTVKTIEARPSQPMSSLKPARSITKVDRANLTFRKPTSTTGASSAALKNTLVSACESGKVQMIEQLLNRGIPPDTGPERNAIHVAICRRDTPTLKLLLEFGGDPDSRDIEGCTPLRITSVSNPEQTKLLLEYGANPNLSGPDWAPIPWAIDGGNIEIVRLLLQYGADPNANSENGQSNMVYAAGAQHAHIMQELIDWGGDPNGQDLSGDTPLVAAAAARKWEVLKVLIDCGADPNMSNESWLAIPWIFDAGNEDSLRYLLEHGADPNGVSKNGESNMCYAASKPFPRMMELLLEFGGDPNRQDEIVETPALHVACSHGHVAHVKLLIQRGADVNQADSSGEVPMDIAAKGGHEEIVMLLLEHME